MKRWAKEPLLTRRWAIATLAAAVLAASLPPAIHAETAAAKANGAGPVCDVFRVRPQDEIWVVNTRWLGCPNGAVPVWTVWKYNPLAPRWLDASAAEFYESGATAPDVVTAMYVHGNRVDSSLALSQGLDVYFQLAGKFDNEPPVRFVIWSWPSDQIRGQLRDVRAKADRSDVDGFFLAQFLAGMQPQAKVGLIGYSFGARIVAGGLHVLGGGSLVGLALPAAPRPRMQVALWAAAEHDHWLLPGNEHGQALGMAEHWLITYNCCDPVLARYRFIDRCKDAVALGYSGVYGRNLLPADLDRRIEEMNVTQIVGGTHDHEPYLYSSAISDRTRAVVLWHE